jgi:hypothetical protein
MDSANGNNNAGNRDNLTCTPVDIQRLLNFAARQTLSKIKNNSVVAAQEFHMRMGDCQLRQRF